MKFVIFIVVIPALTGAITATTGASYFKPDEFWLAVSINFPVCFFCALINCFRNREPA